MCCILLGGIVLSCQGPAVTFPNEKLFVFSTIPDSSFCSENEVAPDTCLSGHLLFTREGKVLLRSGCKGDSISWYRGTYSLLDSNLVQCTFDSRLRTTASAVPGKNQLRFSVIDFRKLLLKKTGCTHYPYISESPLPGFLDPDSSRRRSILAYRGAGTQEVSDYCNVLSAHTVFMDFFCRFTPEPEPATGEKRESPTFNLPDLLLDYFQKKYIRYVMTKKETDTTVVLAFRSTRQEDITDGPFLYVTIPRRESDYLSGDLSGDGQAEILALPGMSDGGTSTWHELFVFARENGELVMKAGASSMDLAVCTRDSYNGDFRPERIENGYILGLSVCFTDEDAQCCPSVKRATRVRFRNDRLKPETD